MKCVSVAARKRSVKCEVGSAIALPQARMTQEN